MTANWNGEYGVAEVEAARAKALFPEKALHDRAVASFIRSTALILSGKFGEADKELEDCYRLAVSGGDLYTQGMALSERARIRIRGGDPESALKLLAQAEVLANSGGSPSLWRGMVYIYMALAHRELGTADKAFSYASQGVDLARLRGSATHLVLGYRLLLDLSLESGDIARCGELLASMEVLLEEFRLYPGSIRCVEEARSAYSKRFRKDEEGPFSPRELEVLELLAQGNTNQEIADRLFVSLGTVKTHLHNISEKLGTTNRVETLAMARRSGYLDK